jgi:EAL domain-containing protein (putative c-di-GMP-specific phosphodiesterase class I)
MQPGGALLPARRWSALALRSRLMDRVDLVTVGRALVAIEADSRPRCVPLSVQSFAAPDFAAALQARLAASASAARTLALEWTEHPAGMAAEAAAALRQAVAGWRRLGVAVGVKHAGMSPKDLPRLKDLGLDYVKVDARHLRGVAHDDAIASYAAGLVGLIHSLELRALADGIDDAADLQELWALGFDGASGGAVAAPPA